MLLLPAWTETYADLQYRSTSNGRNHAVARRKVLTGFPNSDDDAALSKARGCDPAMIDFLPHGGKKHASLKGLNRMYGVLTGTPFGSVKPQDLKHTGNIWR